MLKFVMLSAETDSSAAIVAIYVAIGLWAIMYVIQAFLAYGTAYRCTKNGNDNGFGLFVYLIAFSFAALIPGLGLHYYIKNLPPKIIVQQKVQPQVIRIVDPSQIPNGNIQVQQPVQNEAYQQQMDRQALQAMQQYQQNQQYMQNQQVMPNQQANNQSNNQNN